MPWLPAPGVWPSPRWAPRTTPRNLPRKPAGSRSSTHHCATTSTASCAWWVTSSSRWACCSRAASCGGVTRLGRTQSSPPWPASSAWCPRGWCCSPAWPSRWVWYGLPSGAASCRNCPPSKCSLASMCSAPTRRAPSPRARWSWPRWPCSPATAHSSTPHSPPWPNSIPTPTPHRLQSATSTPLHRSGTPRAACRSRRPASGVR